MKLYPLLLAIGLAHFFYGETWSAKAPPEPLLGFPGWTFANLDRSAFYKAMATNNKDLVNAQLEALKSDPEERKSAFMGTLLMKKASFSGSPNTKLHYFKEGHVLLEEAIKKDPDNAEYRFLRLMIQEHAPGVLGYKKNIENDSELVRKYYKTLPKDVQLAIVDYNKKSKVLKLDVS